jgi:hypothetical protein
MNTSFIFFILGGDDRVGTADLDVLSHFAIASQGSSNSFMGKM